MKNQDIGLHEIVIFIKYCVHYNECYIPKEPLLIIIWDTK